MCSSLSSFLMWRGRVRLTRMSEGRLSTITHSQYLYLLRHLTKEGYFPSKATLMFYLWQGTYLAWDPAMLRSEGCLALQEPGIMGWIGWLSNNLAHERKKKKWDCWKRRTIQIPHCAKRNRAFSQAQHQAECEESDPAAGCGRRILGTARQRLGQSLPSGVIWVPDTHLINNTFYRYYLLTIWMLE